MRVCRTCLSKYDLCPIFGELELTSDLLFIATGVKIEPDDGLPQTACKSCIKTITETLHLRELSSKADEFFKTITAYNVVKTEHNYEHTNVIDPFSKHNYQDPHYFIQQNEQTNDFNDSNDINEYDDDDDDIKPIIGSSSPEHETAIVNIQTKKEIVESDKKTESRNCLTLSKDAQIMLYPTKDGGNKSFNKPEIKKAPIENLLQVLTEVPCQHTPLQITQLEKTITTNKPTNVKYIIKCNADNKKHCKSEICQTILKNKLKKDLANLSEQVENVSDQTTNETGQTPNEPGQTYETGQTANVSDQTAKQLCTVRTEDFISNKELYELFKDSHIFCKKANSNQRANVSIESETSQIEDTKGDHIQNKELRKLFNNRKRFKADEVTSIKRHNITNADLKMPEDDQDETESVHNDDYDNLFGNLLSNLNENFAKCIPNDTRESNVIKKKQNIINPMKMDLNRRKYFKERNKKLMSLAVAPYSEEGPIHCNLCLTVVQSIQSFRSHALKHFEKQHVCQFAGCGIRFVHRGQLTRHEQCVHGVEKKFSCAQCGFRSADRLTMKNHIRAEHTGEKPYECNECGSRFRMRSNIIQHIKQVHFKPKKNIQCEYCPSLFPCRRDLWMHQDKVHFYTYKYYCYLCSNTYRSGYSTRKHLFKLHGIPNKQQLKLRRDKIRKADAPSS